MQIQVVFNDDDLKDPIIKNQLMTWLGVAITPGGIAAIAHKGNGAADTQDYGAVETPAPAPVSPPSRVVRTPVAPVAVAAEGKRGRPSVEEKAEAARLGITVKELRSKASSPSARAASSAPQPTPEASPFGGNSTFPTMPPGINAQSPGHATPSAAMPPTTPPTGHTPTELEAWASKLDARKPGATFNLLDELGLQTLSQVPSHMAAEFTAKIKQEILNIM